MKQVYIQKSKVTVQVILTFLIVKRQHINYLKKYKFILMEMLLPFYLMKKN